MARTSQICHLLDHLHSFLTVTVHFHLTKNKLLLIFFCQKFLETAWENSQKWGKFVCEGDIF